MDSAATYFRNENNFAAGFQLDLIGVLKDLTVDGDGHTFLDLASETRVISFQFDNELPKRGCFQFELGLATSELVARPAGRDNDFRQLASFFSGVQRRQDLWW
jgi:hypothetical protein